MKKDELKTLIKEVIKEGGFVDTVMSVLNPAGKAKELTDTSVKSKKHQKQLSGIIDFYMKQIMSMDDISTLTNSQVVLSILERFYNTIKSTADVSKYPNSAAFVTAFGSIYNLSSYEFKDIKKPGPGETDTLDDVIDYLKNQKFLNNKTLSSRLSSGLRPGHVDVKRIEKKIKKIENDMERVSNYRQRVITSSNDRLKNDLLRFLRTGK